MLYPLSYEGKYWVFQLHSRRRNRAGTTSNIIEERCPALRDASPLFKHACAEERERGVLCDVAVYAGSD
jgi:hypothetical protein